MISAIFSFFSNLFGATKAVSEEVTQRDAEKNTPDQRSNAEAAQIQADRDKAARDVASSDSSELDKDVAP